MSTDPLDALRRSDPAREMRPTPDEVLDARMAELDLPDHEVAEHRRRRRTGRRIMIAGASLLAAGSVAVAAGVRPWERDESRQAGPGRANPDADAATRADYASAIRALRLPPGAEWPAAPPEIGPDTIVPTGRGGMGEAYAVMYAFNRWACTAVRAHERGDLAARGRATVALTDLVDNHMVVVPEGTPEDGAAPAGLPGPIVQMAGSNPSPTQMFHGWIRRAERGDVGALRETCVANRPGG